MENIATRYTRTSIRTSLQPIRRKGIETCKLVSVGDVKARFRGAAHPNNACDTCENGLVPFTRVPITRGKACEFFSFCLAYGGGVLSVNTRVKSSPTVALHTALFSSGVSRTFVALFIALFSSTASVLSRERKLPRESGKIATFYKD